MHGTRTAVEAVPAMTPGNVMKPNRAGNAKVRVLV
jgi:hypothetical protein